MSGKTIEIQKGSGNIFKDLEVSDPDEYLEKARLAFIIEDYITESGFRLEEVAKILNLSTMKLSNLMDGLLDDFSVDYLSSLIRILNSSAVELPDRPTDRFLRWLQQIFGQLFYSKVTWKKAAVGFCVIALLFLFGPRVYQNFSEQHPAATITPNTRSEVVQIEMERQARSNYSTSTNKKDVIPLSLTVPTVVGDDESKQLSKRSR